MKRLVSKNENLDVREFVLRTTPTYPSFADQHDDTFKESDEKSFSRMMNEETIKRLINKEKK